MARYRVAHLFAHEGHTYTNRRHDLAAIEKLPAKVIRHHVEIGNLEDTEGAAVVLPGRMAGVDFTSDEAAELAAEFGLTAADLTALSPSGKSGGYTVADVRKAAPNITKE